MLLSSACQETGVFLAPRELEVATAIPVPNPFPNVPTLWTHFSVNRFVVQLKSSSPNCCSPIPFALQVKYFAHSSLTYWLVCIYLPFADRLRFMTHSI